MSRLDLHWYKATDLSVRGSEFGCILHDPIGGPRLITFSLPGVSLFEMKPEAEKLALSTGYIQLKRRIEDGTHIHWLANFSTEEGDDLAGLLLDRAIAFDSEVYPDEYADPKDIRLHCGECDGLFISPVWVIGKGWRMMCGWCGRRGPVPSDIHLPNPRSGEVVYEVSHQRRESRDGQILFNELLTKVVLA